MRRRDRVFVAPVPIQTPPERTRCGTVLIVVLVIVMLISLAAYNFTLTMESEHMAIRNIGDRFAARQAALSGREILAALLEQPRSQRDQITQIASQPIPLWTSESDDVASHFVTVFLPQQIQQQELAQPGEDSTVPITESSKLNLHTLLQWDEQIPGHGQQALMRLPGMDESVADRLLDWIDADGDQRLQGDETSAPNRIPALIEELSFLAPRTDDGDHSKVDRPPWIDYLTVCSAERNQTSAGMRRVDVNQTDLAMLHRELSESTSVEVANFVTLLRQYGPKPSTGDFTDPSQVTIDFSVSPSFELTSLAQLIGTTVAMTAGDKTEVVASPIDGHLGGGGKSIDQVFDLLTVTPLDRLEGRVDLRTAPAEVISAIPGISPSQAEQIVAARRSANRDSVHAIGILMDAAIDPAMASELLNRVTVGGDVMRAVFSGSIDRSATYTCEVLVDASYGRARQIYLRELSRRPADATGQHHVQTDPETRFPPRSSNPFQSSIQ